MRTQDAEPLGNIYGAASLLCLQLQICLQFAKSHNQCKWGTCMFPRVSFVVTTPLLSYASMLLTTSAAGVSMIDDLCPFSINVCLCACKHTLVHLRTQVYLRAMHVPCRYMHACSRAVDSWCTNALRCITSAIATRCRDSAASVCTSLEWNRMDAADS